ncbi:MAG: nuclease-related domain-containing protein [Lacisediminihabitans sp.]
MTGGYSMTHSVTGNGTEDGHMPFDVHPLGERSSGQFAIGELLRVQAAQVPRSRWARLFGASPIGVEGQPWFETAVGEVFVGELLAGLGDEWVVFHSVPVGVATGAPVGVNGADIDHLVIGPPGCFTITVRNHPGLDIAVSGRTVLVAGAKVSCVRDAEHNLGRAERLLSAALGVVVTVTGLLVFVEPESLSSHDVPRDLEVLSSSELLPWLAAQPKILATAEVERIGATAGRPEVWGDAALAVDDNPSAIRDFERLRRSVVRSRMLRQLWFGVITILSIVTITAIATLAILNLAPGRAH